jgi:hypothetical protein
LTAPDFHGQIEQGVAFAPESIAFFQTIGYLPPVL